MLKRLAKWITGAVAVLVIALVAFVALFYRGGHFDQTESHVLGETRGFKVFLPAGYEDNPSLSYPVIYSLDGEKIRHGELMAANARMLAALTNTPELILVAVYSHGHRERDFSPARGAAAFTNYLSAELMPYIDDHFRTSGRNVISGHSYGGLYALYAFTDHPGLFDAHFAYVPSVFHFEPILERLKERLDDREAPKTHLFLVSGAESQQKFWDGFNSVVGQLQNRPYQSVTWQAVYYPLPHAMSMVPGQIAAMAMLQFSD